MSSIDERIVEMKFNNSDFENGAKKTIGTLDSLKNSLKLQGATKGLDDVGAAAKKFSLASMAQSIDSIASKFGAMSVVGLTALTNIANRAINVGISVAKSLTISPVTQGLDIYQTKLISIQTILANTGLTGQTGLNKVNGALAALNTYSNQTIYNFGEMARNIGTFTAAGVKLDVSVQAIKGIANLAAVSGSNAQQASSAMYQLSQALAAGSVKLQDWNSIVNAGLGGKVFQNALEETARVHGVEIDKMVKKQKGFRNTLQKGWLTSQILTETLGKFTGDLTAQQLKAQGYTEKQIKSIMALAKVATEAATKVKTLPQLMDVLKESVATGWATTWEIVIGNLSEAKTLFTNVNNVIGGFITASGNARNKVLGDWKALGGRTALIKTISNVFNDLIAVMEPIQKAFRSIFPATTGKELYNITIALRNFTAGLKIGGDTADKLQRTFSGVFAVLHIGVTIVEDVLKLFGRLFSSATKGSSSFLDTTASVGDFLVNLDKTLSKGGQLEKFFKRVGDDLEKPIDLLRRLGSYLESVFKKVDTSGLSAGITSVLSALGSLISVDDLGGPKIQVHLDGIIRGIINFAGEVAKASAKVGDAIVGIFSNVDYGKVLSTINTGLFAVLTLAIKKFLSGFRKGGVDTGGFVDSITGAFNELTNTLKSMQNTLRATTLLEIAAAIGILTISVTALSKIDAAGLSKALTAMGVMFTQLFSSMLIFDKVSKSKGFAKMPLVTGAMILLAIAVDILAIAVKKLADLNWGELAKGLTGVTVLILGLAVAVKIMEGKKDDMIKTGAGLILLAAAIRVLVGAVTDLSGLSWEEMAKGLIGVGVLLAALTLFTKFSDTDKAGVLKGAGIVLLSVGIKILASAVKDFSTMDWENISKGLLTMSLALAAISAALIAVPPSAVLSSISIANVSFVLKSIASFLKDIGNQSWESISKGLVALAGSLTIIGFAMAGLEGGLPGALALIVVSQALAIVQPVLEAFGKMDWENIGKAMVVLAGSLTIIGLAMAGMEAALPGAAALLVVSAALAILQPVLKSFGDMSWESIAKGLISLAGALTIIGIAGLVLTPVIPTLLGLGLAVTLLGVGFAAAGVGVLSFAVGLTALAAAGTAGAAAIVLIVAGLIGLIPLFAKEVGLGIIAFAQVISTAGPIFLKAMVTILNAFLDAIDTLTPKIIKLFFKLLNLLLDALDKYVPKLVNKGLHLLVGILKGIENNIGMLVQTASDVIVAFLKGVQANQGRVTDQGVKTIISFVNGVANAIRNNQAQMNAAGRNLGSAIIEGMVGGIEAGLGAIKDAASKIAHDALQSAKNVLGIHSPSKEFEKIGAFVVDGFVKGITGNRDKIGNTFTDLETMLTNMMANARQDMQDSVTKLNKLTTARENDVAAIADTHKELTNLNKTNGKYLADIETAEKRLKALQEVYNSDQSSINAAGKDKAKLKAANEKARQDEKNLKEAQNNLENLKQAQLDGIDAIDSAQVKLQKLTDARSKDTAAIKDTEAALAEARSELSKSNHAYSTLETTFGKDRAILEGLADKYDELTQKLNDATQVLDDAKKTRDDYLASLQDEFSRLPDLTGETKLVDYIDGLKKEIEDTQSFATAIQKLRELGLNDVLYKELIAKGIASLPFVNQLLDAGGEKVAELNALQTNLESIAGTLGTAASQQLYQAAVNAAQGFVDGLASQKDAIAAQMSEIANELVAAIKNDLGIASPSKVFAEIGKFTAQGLAKGLYDASALIETSAAGLGSAAILAMSKSISGMSDILAGEFDLNPTITPVLDLSAVRKNATLLDTMLSGSQVSVDTSVTSANQASLGIDRNKAAQDAIAQAATGDTFNFTQNNTSPKALSEADIYRQTKNQLSAAKGASS